MSERVDCGIRVRVRVIISDGTDRNSPGNAVISPMCWDSQQLKVDPLRAWPLYYGGIYVPVVADWVTPL